MLDFLGFAATLSLIIFMIGSLIMRAEASTGSRSVVLALAAAWVGLAGAAAGANWLAISRPFPVIGLFVFSPLIAAALIWFSAGARNATQALPMPLLIGLNFGRVFAILFLLLDDAGRLAGPFPFFAGWGDIITGVVAVPLAFVASGDWRKQSGLPAAIFAWNFFGICDLVLAIFLGVTSSDGSPLQIFNYPPGSAAMQQLPFSFVPTVLVPFYLIIHAVIWARIVSREPVKAGVSNR